MKIYHLGADDTVVQIHIPEGPMGASFLKKIVKKAAPKAIVKAVAKAVPKPKAIVKAIVKPPIPKVIAKAVPKPLAKIVKKAAPAAIIKKSFAPPIPKFIAKAMPKPLAKVVAKAQPAAIIKATQVVAKQAVKSPILQRAAVVATGGAALISKDVRKTVASDFTKIIDAAKGEIKLRLQQLQDKIADMGLSQVPADKRKGLSGLEPWNIGFGGSETVAARESAKKYAIAFVTKEKAAELAVLTGTVMASFAYPATIPAALAAFALGLAKLIPIGAAYVAKGVAADSAQRLAAAAGKKAGVSPATTASIVGVATGKASAQDVAKAAMAKAVAKVAPKALPPAVAAKIAPASPVPPASVVVKPAAPAAAAAPAVRPAPVATSLVSDEEAAAPVAAAAKPGAPAKPAAKAKAKAAPAKKGFIDNLLALFGVKKAKPRAASVDGPDLSYMDRPSPFGASEDPHGPFCYGYMISYLSGMLAKHDKRMREDPEYRKEFLINPNAQRQHDCVVASLKLAHQRGGSK
jgi:hypothetical protein